MSVELRPNHKAILNYYNSLRVYEIDMLAYLTDFLSQSLYQERHFEIYVKPTLHRTIFDFVIVEPKQAIYLLQTPHSKEEYIHKKENTQHFLETKLHELSPMLKRNLEIMNPSQAEKKRQEVIQTLFYIFEEELYDSLSDEEKEKVLIAADFSENEEALQELFEVPVDDRFSLTGKESAEIQAALNPNSNLVDYVPKTLSQENQVKAKSVSQAKQKFKGPAASGKTTLLVQRIISCANRLNGKGEILVVPGDYSQVDELKELITAEDGRSLQELGVQILAADDLEVPLEKFSALFVDDAERLNREIFEDLLENYLVEMVGSNDFEYVVMASEEKLPKIPQIFGPYSTIDEHYQEMSNLLAQSRKIFLEILSE